MRESHEVVWNNCLRIIKDIIPPTSYNTWFRPVRATKLERNVITISVPSTFFYEYLEEHFIDLLKKVVRKELGPNARLEYSIVVDNSKKSAKPQTVQYPSANGTALQNRPINVALKSNEVKNPFVIPGIKKLNINPQLNLSYNFDNYIEGTCNRLGRSAGKAVAANPGGTAFNPLFLYGESGMGKTHLAQAIGIEVKEQNPEKVVLYVSANKFQTQFTEAARKNNRNDFMHFYQMIDVLIIDDVHEFAGKVGTQDTFFHIFNHLHQSGKQLILTSDRPPAELTGLTKRLISRFKWGLTAEITEPDEETRKEILQKKAHLDGIKLSDEIITYLAQNLSGSVRELEGTLISLLAHATLIKQEITIDTAQSMIGKLIKRKRIEVSIPGIIKVVSSHFNLEPEVLQAKNRKREIVQARQIAMFFSKKMTNYSLSAIGAEIGGKDHATVLHSYKTVKNLIETDKNFKSHIIEIGKKLNTAV